MSLFLLIKVCNFCFRISFFYVLFLFIFVMIHAACTVAFSGIYIYF